VKVPRGLFIYLTAVFLGVLVILVARMTRTFRKMTVMRSLKGYKLRMTLKRRCTKETTSASRYSLWESPPPFNRIWASRRV
jgi:hypothetical protein